MDGIERFFHSAETFTAQVLDPVAGNTALTGESQSLLTTPELQTFLGTTWAKARLYEGWDDTARLGLWVAWLIRLLIERHVKSGVYAEDALVGLLMAYGLYAERILTNRIVADRPKLNELADRFKNRQWAVAALAAAGLDWPDDLPMPVEALSRNKSSLSRYLKDARLLIFREAGEAFGIAQSGERKPAKQMIVQVTASPKSDEVQGNEPQPDITHINEQIVIHYLRRRGLLAFALEGESTRHLFNRWSVMEPESMYRFMRPAASRNAVIGRAGMGKSTYLGEFLLLARKTPEFLLVPIDPVVAADRPDITAVARYWLTKIGLETEAVESVVGSHHDTLLAVVDDVDRFAGIGRVKWLQELSGLRHCLVAGRSLPTGLVVDFPWYFCPLTLEQIDRALSRYTERTGLRPDELRRLWRDADLQACLSWPLFLREFGDRLIKAPAGALWRDVTSAVLDTLVSQVMADDHARMQAIEFISVLTRRWWMACQEDSPQPVLQPTQDPLESSLLAKMVDAGVFCVSSRGVSGLEFSHPILLEHHLARIDDVSPSAVLKASHESVVTLNFNRWVRLRLEHLAEHRQFKSIWEFLQSVGVGHFDLLSHSWLNVLGLMPMKDQLVGDDESFDLLVNVIGWAAQAQAAVRSDETAEWSRCQWLMQQWDAVQAKSVARTHKPNNVLDELRQYYYQIKRFTEDLTQNYSQATIGEWLSANPLKRNSESDAKRISAISFCRFVEPTFLVEYGRFIQREMAITDVLLGIAGSEAEEVFTRLCAASVLVSWGDKRVQPALEALATNESYNGRSRTRLLQLALDGNPAAQQWV